jgi:hypothetical protein
MKGSHPEGISRDAARGPGPGIGSRNRPPLTLGERFRIGASLIPPFAILFLCSRRGWIPLTPWIGLGGMLLGLAAGMLLPAAFEPWHLGFSRVQAWIGRRIVAVLLGMVFLLVVLPIGLLLRWSGRGFLDRGRQDSYWHPARPPGSLKDGF